MKSNKNMVPGFDEIIFENRNKVYGAYDLRKFYMPVLSFSALSGIVIFILFVFFLSLVSKKDATAEDRSPVIVVIRPDSAITELNKIKAPDPEILRPDIRPYRYIAPVIVEKLDSTDITLAPVTEIDSVRNRPVDEEIRPMEEPEVMIVNKEPEPVFFAEEPPLFPGGDAALMKFIYENIRYPEEAAENNIEGRVVIKFVVSADGSVKRAEVLKSVHPALDSEALRVIQAMPKWKPGRQNGTPVPVWFRVPVKFELRRQ